MKFHISFSTDEKPDIVSKGIMKFLGTDYSHVFIRDKDIIYHATGIGVHATTVSEFLAKGKKIVREVEVDLDIDSKNLSLYMRGSAGKEYSSSQYLGFVIPFLSRFVQNVKEKMICSELVADVLKEFGGYKIPKPHDFMSPKDIYELIKR